MASRRTPNAPGRSRSFVGRNREGVQSVQCWQRKARCRPYPRGVSPKLQIECAESVGCWNGSRCDCRSRFPTCEEGHSESSSGCHSNEVAGPETLTSRTSSVCRQDLSCGG